MGLQLALDGPDLVASLILFEPAKPRAGGGRWWRRRPRSVPRWRRRPRARNSPPRSANSSATRQPPPPDQVGKLAG
jgi:pimeloyl-ACP methyl ester carboxylesterase